MFVSEFMDRKPTHLMSCFQFTSPDQYCFILSNTDEVCAVSEDANIKKTTKSVIQSENSIHLLSCNESL